MKLKYIFFLLSSFFLFVSCEKEGIVPEKPVTTVKVEEAIWDFRSGDNQRSYKYIAFDGNELEIRFLIKSETIQFEYSISYPYYFTGVEGDWRYKVHYLREGNTDYVVWAEIHFVDDAIHLQLYEGGSLSKTRMVFTKREG